MIKSMIKILFHNWLVKLISLLAAILLWFYYNYDKNPERYFSIPLKLINIPQNLALAESFQNTVTVKVKGEEAALQGISVKNFRIPEVDLKNAYIGDNIFPIKVKLIKNIKKIRIVSVDPDKVIIKMEKLTLKEVPVSITVINSPVEGYIKTGETFTPETIVISGPYSIINALNIVRTKPIDIGGVTGSIYKEVELDLPSELISAYNYQTINVNINIKKNYQLNYFNKVRILIKNLKDNLKIANKDDLYAAVKVDGPPERLEVLARENDFLFVDLSDVFEKDTYVKKIRYKVPLNCSLKKIEPEEIKIIIEENTK